MPGQNPFCYMPGHIHPHLLTLSQLPLFSKLAVSAEGQGQGWVPGHALGGHYGAVVDMCWGVDGSCLLTASTDQTCRITVQNEGRWSELARPQASLATTTAFKALSNIFCCATCMRCTQKHTIPLLYPHECACLTDHSFHRMFDMFMHAHRYMGMTCLA